MKVAVLTTSYPRGPRDTAGLFVADAVEHLREAGVDVEVVSPASFRHFGLAYGAGIVGNVRAPALARAAPAGVPASRSGSRRVEQRAASTSSTRTGSASALVGALLRRPLVVQPLGDRRRARASALPWLARAGSSGAPPPWSAPSTRARGRGARARRRACARDPERSRASPTRSARRTSRRTCSTRAASPRRRACSSSSRPRAACRSSSSATGRCASGCRARSASSRTTSWTGSTPARPSSRVPSHREGFGVVCAEAMAHGEAGRRERGRRAARPRRRRRDGHARPARRRRRAARRARAAARPTGELRRRLGEAGRARVRERFGWEAVTAATLRVYEDALGERA